MDKPETTLNSEVLACPARFERAAWALEAVKMSRNNKLDGNPPIFNRAQK
jgi:hypothetical protein